MLQERERSSTLSRRYRVPTRFVQKYTLSGRPEPSGAHEAVEGRAGDARLAIAAHARCRSARRVTVAARRWHGYSPPSAIHASSRQSAPATISGVSEFSVSVHPHAASTARGARTYTPGTRR